MELSWLQNQNEPPRPRPPRPEDDGLRDRQTVLFAGMDCLPGQLDLFQTDGKLESQSCTH